MNLADTLVLRALRHPEALLALPQSQWDLLLRQARRAGILARLGFRLEERGLLDQLPAKVRDHLQAARTMAGKNERVARWEVNRILRALAGTDVPIVLLKGAAYVMAELPVAAGRFFSDVDFMVRKDALPLVEEALMRHGWEAVKLDPYDQRYYRTWMHELPPLFHRDRRTVVDVHHTILPESSRLHPDPQRLLDAARPIRHAGLRVLAPPHMVLHSAAHLFQDGDLRSGLQNLTDLDALLRHFGPEAGFWEELALEARRLDLKRPLFYALRYTQRLLRTPIPSPAMSAAQAGQPAWPAALIMDRLVTRALAPAHPERADWTSDLARRVLFVRSHWLRMPPWLLARHLFRKALTRWFPSVGAWRAGA